VQGVRVGEKEARALQLFRQLNISDRKLFIMMGWEIFKEAGKEAIIQEEYVKKIDVVDVN